MDQLSRTLYESCPDVTSLAAARRIVRATFEAAGKAIVEHGGFSAPGFGTVKFRQEENPGVVRSPRTGESVVTRPRIFYHFKPTEALRATVNLRHRS